MALATGWSSPDSLRDLLHALRTPLWIFRRQTLQEDDHGLRGLHLGRGYPGWIIYAGKSSPVESFHLMDLLYSGKRGNFTTTEAKEK